MAKRRSTWTADDAFLIGLIDGSHSVGQVIGVRPKLLNSVACVFFEGRLPPASGPESTAERAGAPIAAVLTTRDLLDSGVWRVVDAPGLAGRSADFESVGTGPVIGQKVYGSGIMVNFLNAFHGLAPWDQYKDPEYFNKLLLPHVQRRVPGETR